MFQALVELNSSTFADIRAPTQAVLRNIFVSVLRFISLNLLLDGYFRPMYLDTQC